MYMDYTYYKYWGIIVYAYMWRLCIDWQSEYVNEHVFLNAWLKKKAREYYNLHFIC